MVYQMEFQEPQLWSQSSCGLLSIYDLEGFEWNPKSNRRRFGMVGYCRYGGFGVVFRAPYEIVLQSFRPWSESFVALSLSSDVFWRWSDLVCTLISSHDIDWRSSLLFFLPMSINDMGNGSLNGSCNGPL